LKTFLIVAVVAALLYWYIQYEDATNDVDGVIASALGDI
jgi:hypothetical protein